MTMITGDKLGEPTGTCEFCGVEFTADALKEAFDLLWKHIDECHPEKRSAQSDHPTE